MLSFLKLNELKEPFVSNIGLSLFANINSFIAKLTSRIAVKSSCVNLAIVSRPVKLSKEALNETAVSAPFKSLKNASLLPFA